MEANARSSGESVLLPSTVQAAAAAVAALPGLGTFFSGLGVPRHLTVALGGIYTIGAALTVLLVAIHRRRIFTWSPRRTTLTVGLLVTAALSSFVVYQFLYGKTVIHVTDSRSGEPRTLEFYLPLQPDDELKKVLHSPTGKYIDAIDNSTPERFAEELQEPRLALRIAVTDLALLVSYLVIAVGLAAALAIAGWRAAAPDL